MLRKLHGLPSLAVMLFVITLACTGAVLSLMPTFHRAAAMIPAVGEVSVATLAQHVVTHFPQAERIERDLSGEVIVHYQLDEKSHADLVNPLTGESIAPYQPSAVMVWLKDLHRSFLLGDTGRIMAGVTAGFMVLICLSGTFLLVRRIGGWKALVKPFKGKGGKRIHSELARFAVLGLLLSSLTGAYMSALRFGVFTDHTYVEAEFPNAVSGGQPASVGSLAVLTKMDLSELRELIFPVPDDTQDVYSLTTRHGAGFVDQSTGQWLSFEPLPESGALQQWVTKLHTGEGLWWLGLILGASALTVPVLSYTGTKSWWLRRRSAITQTNSQTNKVSIEQADTIILVGSEGNTTWGFALDLQANLSKAGCKVYCADMNQLAEHYPQAKRLFILTSTYGNGDAPSSAHHFLAKLATFQADQTLQFAVLGFGDLQFPQFCQYALDVDTALQNKGIARLHSVGLINRGSSAQFREWGNRITHVTNISLALTHNPQPTPTAKLTLIDREDYGLEGLAATSIFRFSAVGTDSLPLFEAGDLLGVMPPKDDVARFYSLASSTTDGVLEICVRKQPYGLCSGYLHALKLGDGIEGFIRQNPEFRPAVGGNPVILIGAGAGIGPLAGFIRKNTQRNPMFLYWGGRNEEADFLYQPDLGRYLNDHRLTGLQTAFSQAKSQASGQITEKTYVQDKLLQDQTAVRQMLEQGAQILVCGGRDMAAGVAQAINDILKPLQINVDALKAQGRYLEDVY
ncbi:PepSY domain-containing protein [Marinomonas polaris]|uniref:PepSY domain-containing protein n=1 Tax=Marinomonas polaris TaxID=293552 RepID=UPI003F94E065